MENKTQPDKTPPHLLEATLAGLPELKEFDDDERRRAALREIGEEAGNIASGGFWLGLTILVGSTVLSWIVTRWVLAAIGWRSWLETLVLGIVIGGTFWLVLRRLHRTGARRELREKLLQQGVPVCLNCGYVLRGLPTDSSRCSECGETISERTAGLIRGHAGIIPP
jgi:hypothetical protein